MSDALEHHGVLGMKWGVRRYQPYPKGKHGTFLGQSRDEDIVIKKGTEAYRVQSGPELRKGQTYVSFDKIDHLQYLGFAASGEGGIMVDMYNTNADGSLEGDPRSVRMKLTEDIIAPSYQATMDSFIETMGKVKIKDIEPDLDKRYMKPYVDKFLKDVKNTKVDKCRDDAYLYFIRTFMRDTEAKKLFFDSLKRKGYNAIIDENDARFGNKDDTSINAPLILFDSSSAKVTSAKQITKAEGDMFADVFFSGELRPSYADTAKYWEKWGKTKLSEVF